MKYSVQHEGLGTITYEESFWTGSRKLTINGVELNKLSKTQFKTSDGREVTLTGNSLVGVKATIGAETIALTPPLTWYELVLSIVPFAIMVLWGNIPVLSAIVPIAGGAIGGVICGLFIGLNLFFVKLVKKIYLKIVITIGCAGTCFALCYYVGLIILAIFSL